MLAEFGFRERANGRMNLAPSGASGNGRGFGSFTISAREGSHYIPLLQQARVLLALGALSALYAGRAKEQFYETSRTV